MFWMAQLRVPVLVWYQQIFNRQIFWHSLGVPPPRRPPKKLIFWTAQFTVPVSFDTGDPQKSIFSSTQLWVPVCFDINRYLTDKYFGIVWGVPPPYLGDSPKWTPKINFLNGSTYHASVLWYQEIFNWQIFWLYFSAGPIIRCFWIIIADLTIDKKYIWESQH